MWLARIYTPALDPEKNPYCFGKEFFFQSLDWHTNGAGYNVSHAFGFGLMDAGAMVNQALNWTSVPDQKVIVSFLYFISVIYKRMVPEQKVTIRFLVVDVTIKFDAHCT